MAIGIRRPAAGNAARVPDSSVALVVLVGGLPIAVVIEVGGADHIRRYVLVGVGTFAALLTLLVELVQAVGRQELHLFRVDGVRAGEAQRLVGPELLVHVLAGYFHRARRDSHDRGVVLGVGVDTNVARLVDQNRTVGGVNFDRCGRAIETGERAGPHADGTLR